MADHKKFIIIEQDEILSSKSGKRRVRVYQDDPDEINKVTTPGVESLVSFDNSVIINNPTTSDVSGALFGFLKAALIISFVVNIFQYFDVTVMEEEIRSSVISYFLMDFAPKTLSIFIDFFPSLEVIVESSDQLKKIDV